MAVAEDRDWDAYFAAVASFLIESERQYGVCNDQYTNYALEQLEFLQVTCRTLIRVVSQQTALGTISALLLDLLSCLTTLRSRWQSYSDTITTHQTRNFRPLLYSGMPGRPRFDVSRDEIEYLRSLFFSWSEIAALIGISRSTLYRRRVELDLINDPTSHLSDTELASFVAELQLTSPNIGQSLVIGKLRSLGYRVSRQRVRNTLRLNNPLTSALRWPGIMTHRRPYSVPGPNSLWHIGKYKLRLK